MSPVSAGNLWQRPAGWVLVRCHGVCGRYVVASRHAQPARGAFRRAVSGPDAGAVARCAGGPGDCAWRPQTRQRAEGPGWSVVGNRFRRGPYYGRQLREGLAALCAVLLSGAPDDRLDRHCGGSLGAHGNVLRTAERATSLQPDRRVESRFPAAAAFGLIPQRELARGPDKRTRPRPGKPLPIRRSARGGP